MSVEMRVIDRLRDYPGWVVVWRSLPAGEIIHPDSRVMVLDVDGDRLLRLEHALVHVELHLAEAERAGGFTASHEEQADFLAAVRLDRVDDLCAEREER